MSVENLGFDILFIKEQKFSSLSGKTSDEISFFLHDVFFIGSYVNYFILVVRVQNNHISLYRLKQEILLPTQKLIFSVALPRANPHFLIINGICILTFQIRC